MSWQMGLLQAAPQIISAVGTLITGKNGTPSPAAQTMIQTNHEVKSGVMDENVKKIEKFFEDAGGCVSRENYQNFIAQNPEMKAAAAVLQSQGQICDDGERVQFVSKAQADQFHTRMNQYAKDKAEAYERERKELDQKLAQDTKG